ncbi:MAG: phosphotransferase family protein [Mycobacteriales bacterium]
MLPLQRLAAVAQDAGLRSIAGAVRLPSASNEAWKVDEVVVRISWSSDRVRAQREVRMLEDLPSSVPHPKILGNGVTADRTWTLTKWVPGEVVMDVWAAMSPVGRDRLAGQLADALAALHEWTPSRGVREQVAQRGRGATVDDLIGQDVNPVPIDRTLALVNRAKQAAYADPAVIDAVAERLNELRPFDVGSSDDPVIHGDMTLMNLVAAGSSLQTLLDFEWVRLGPADLDLQGFLRPEPEADAGDMIRRLAVHYPRIVSHPSVVERLWLYDLACTLRDIIVCPASTSPEHLRPDHPLRRLPVIVESPVYINELLDR